MGLIRPDLPVAKHHTVTIAQMAHNDACLSRRIEDCYCYGVIIYDTLKAVGVTARIVFVHQR